jgi:hypothetical protein
MRDEHRDLVGWKNSEIEAKRENIPLTLHLLQEVHEYSLSPEY